MDAFLYEATDSGEVLAIPRRFKTYEVTGTIGTGSYAVVVGVSGQSRGVTLAAKVMRRPKPNTEEMRLVERELRLCETVSCHFLVTCVDVVYTDDLIILVMERGEGTDLLSLITQGPHIVAANWLTIFRQICYGVQYLHSHGLAHRDLKPENILVDETFNCKLCDYGLLCEVKPTTLNKTKYGTLPYMSPEMIYSETYNGMQSDIWALGVVLYVISTGCVPWKGESDAAIGQEITLGITDTESVGRIEEELILKCCSVNPETRPTIDEILANPAFNVQVKTLQRNQSLPLKNVRGATRRNVLVKPNVKACETGVKLTTGLHMGSQKTLRIGQQISASVIQQSSSKQMVGTSSSHMSVSRMRIPLPVRRVVPHIP